LAKKPGYTIAAMLTLALGIGANTAIFSGLNAILLKALLFRDPDNLMAVYLASPGSIAQLDARVLGFNFAIALLAGLLFGVLPALRASRADLNGVLKRVAGGPGEVFGRFRRMGPLSLLVGAEIALSFVLLIGAGLMLRSFEHTQQTALGFDPKNVLTFPFESQRAAGSLPRQDA
jgi:hypothetical protein